MVLVKCEYETCKRSHVKKITTNLSIFGFCSSGWIPNVSIVDGDHVCIANGIRSIHFSKAFMAASSEAHSDGTFYAYCRMIDESLNGDGVYVGDIHITDDQGRYLGIFGGVQFKRVRKGILDRLMGLGGTKNAPKGSSSRG